MKSSPNLLFRKTPCSNQKALCNWSHGRWCSSDYKGQCRDRKIWEVSCGGGKEALRWISKANWNSKPLRKSHFTSKAIWPKHRDRLKRNPVTQVVIAALVRSGKQTGQREQPTSQSTAHTVFAIACITSSLQSIVRTWCFSKKVQNSSWSHSTL